jgi:cytochrome c-type biogenesis protein CcmH
MIRRGLTLLLLWLALALPVLAVQPDEVLDDPVLEARAREISKELRCLVCRNESIDESNADLARDLRLLVRERLVAGDSNQEVLDYMVDRYGEYVLLRPPFSWKNAALWLAAPVLLLIGGGVALAFVRQRRRRAPAAPPETELSPEEAARLERLLHEDDAR